LTNDREEAGTPVRPEDMSDEERKPEAELDAEADDAEDVEAHSLPLPPPRPMNSL
jgi:hypothetical protein